MTPQNCMFHFFFFSGKNKLKKDIPQSRMDLSVNCVSRIFFIEHQTKFLPKKNSNIVTYISIDGKDNKTPMFRNLNYFLFYRPVSVIYFFNCWFRSSPILMQNPLHYALLISTSIKGYLYCLDFLQLKFL